MIFPLPKTIAFGGVATGSMNANDAEIVAGIISSIGFISIATASDARIGRIVFVVAVFDVSYVRNVRTMHTMKMIRISGTPLN